MSKPDLKALLEKAYQTAHFLSERAEEASTFLILTHFDADGLAAGSILAAALTRLNASFHIRVVNDLNEKLIDDVLKIRHEILVFSEMGSGYLELIENKCSTNKTVVIDHHPVLGEAERFPYHVNPCLYGFDGSKDISGAGMMYLVAKEMKADNTDLSVLAVVGALGDTQDRNEKKRLEGLNALIVEEASNSGLLKEETDLILFGRETRPLHKALASTTSPFLPGLSGREDRCLSLLSSANIDLKMDDRWRTVSDLTDDEKRRLISRIVEHLSAEGHDLEAARGLIGSVYTLLGQEPGTALRDGREYATALNACGRMGKHGLGISACLGDRTAILQVEDVLKEYRATLAGYMELILGNECSTQELKHLVVVRGENSLDERMSGAVSSMLCTSGRYDKNRVLLVVTRAEDGSAKISARIQENLKDSPIDLGKLMYEASVRNGGMGGGHKVAAGAKVPMEKLESFLKDVEDGAAQCLKK
ncbi:MAG: DHH family phosphoesterase [Candidatus Bathyarchaeia archaeon]